MAVGQKCGQKRCAAKKRDPDNNRVITWNESFVFVDELRDDASLIFTVVRVHRAVRNNIGSSCERRAIDLLEIQNSSGSHKLDIAGRCQLTFNIEKLPDVVSGGGITSVQASATLEN